MSEETSKKGKEITIEIDPRPMEELLLRAKKAEDDQEGFREIASDLSKSMQKEGIIIDSRDITKDNFRENVHKLQEALADTKSKLEEMDNRDFNGISDNVGQGSAGRSNLQSQGGKKTFSSHKDLVNHLTELEIEQNPNNDPNSNSEAKRTKDALWQKYVNALKQRKIHQPVEFIPEDEKSDEPIIGKYIENANKRKRALQNGEK